MLELSGENWTGVPAASPRTPKQKISLGRGLVREDVAAILFDEPLTVIDPHLKWQLRRKLKQIHHELKLTLVYVTHDQVEALTFADQVDGDVARAGWCRPAPPTSSSRSPSHVFVGHFIGSPGMNFLPVTPGGRRAAGRRRAAERRGHRAAGALAARAAGDGAGAQLVLGIRPEYVRLAAEGDAGTVDAVTERIQDLGTSMLITARVGTASIKLRTPVQTDFQTSLAAAGAAAVGRPLQAVGDQQPQPLLSQPGPDHMKPINQKAWLLVLPVVICVAFSAVLPLMTVVNYSVQDILSPTQRVFVGTEWFKAVMRDRELHEASIARWCSRSACWQWRFRSASASRCRCRPPAGAPRWCW